MIPSDTKLVPPARDVEVDEKHGVVQLCFSTFDRIDRDGDITRPGAIPSGDAVLSSYGHKSWEGVTPLGWCTITSNRTEAVATAHFLLGSQPARECFQVVAALATRGLGQWSYSLEGIKSKIITLDGRRVREITGMNTVREVSPVLAAAGINTRTISTQIASVGDAELLDIYERHVAGPQREAADSLRTELLRAERLLRSS